MFLGNCIEGFIMEMMPWGEDETSLNEMYQVEGIGMKYDVQHSFLYQRPVVPLKRSPRPMT